MKNAGHDRILRLKIKRFEIILNNCKVYIFLDSIALLMARSVRQIQHQSSCWRKIVKCSWIVFMLHGIAY